MKRTVLILLVLVAMLMTSCTATKAFVSDMTLSPEIPLEEKFLAYGGREVLVDLPETYFHGSEWLERMIELVNESEDYILISSYLASGSESLEPLFAAIQKKAEEGLRIYYIIDGTAEEDMTDSRYVMVPLYYLRDYGVKVLSYSPTSFTRLLNPVGLMVRDHRKLMVFDGKIAVLGGMNTNYISMGAGEASQRDAMFVFHSPSLASLCIEEFASIWNKSSVEKMDPASFVRYEDTESTCRAWLFNRNIYEGKVSIAGMYGSLFAEAKDSLLVCPFLPTMDKNMKNALKNAVDRGVDVVIYSSMDPRGYANKGSYYTMAGLIEDSGATVYNVSDDKDGNELPLFHLKMTIVDDRYIVIGSSNMNYRSMNLSHEIAMVIDSPELVVEAKAKAMEIAENPVLLTKEKALKDKKEKGNFFCYLFTYYGG